MRVLSARQRRSLAVSLAPSVSMGWAELFLMLHSTFCAGFREKADACVCTIGFAGKS